MRMSSASLKQLTDNPLHDDFFHIKQKEKIKPIPIIYSKFQDQKDSEAVNKISVRGYKIISRIAATGESTLDTLEMIKRSSSSLKLIKSLEFDPYFEKTSGLKQLCKTLKRFKKTLSALNLVVRRVTSDEEIKDFIPIVSRLRNLMRLRMELPHTKGITAKGRKLLVESCRECYSVKSIELHLAGLKFFPGNLKAFGSGLERLHRLEKIRYYLQTDHLPASLKQECQEDFKIRKQKNLKSFAMEFSFKTNWASYFDGFNADQPLPFFLKSLADATNLTRLSLCFDKLQLSTKALTEIAAAIPLFKNLQFLFLQITNIKMGELETLILAKGFLMCKKLEHLIFKYIDNGTVPLLDIFQFILIMAQHAPFPKFDLFFRKLFYPEWQSTETRNKLAELKNIEYTLTKQSLHIRKVNAVFNDNVAQF